VSVLSALIPPPGPIRILCLSNLAKTVGNGLIMAVGLLYLTRSAGMPVNQVGAALSIGGVLGLLASVPAGHLADRLGPRRTTIFFLCLQGLFLCGYPLVSGLTSLILVVSAVLVVESSAESARSALIAGVIRPGERVRAWSYLRSISNIGISVGAVAGGAGQHFDSAAGYTALLLLAGVLVVTSGVMYMRVPAVPGRPATSDGPALMVLRDGRFAAVAGLNAVLTVNTVILTVAIPVWITMHTSAPAWTYSAVLLINTSAVVLLQVRMSRGSERIAGGARAMRRAGAFLALACVLLALAAGLPTWAAMAVLALGAIGHVIGEMQWSAGSWSLGFGLAPDHAQGQYQGLFNMSTQLGTMATPFLVLALITGAGRTGWLVLGAVLLTAGLCVPAVAGWAARNRTRFRDTHELMEVR
jgi:sugar phosphate permease